MENKEKNSNYLSLIGFFTTLFTVILCYACIIRDLDHFNLSIDKKLEKNRDRIEESIEEQNKLEFDYYADDSLLEVYGKNYNMVESIVNELKNFFVFREDFKKIDNEANKKLWKITYTFRRSVFQPYGADKYGISAINNLCPRVIKLENFKYFPDYIYGTDEEYNLFFESHKHFIEKVEIFPVTTLDYKKVNVKIKK